MTAWYGRPVSQNELGLFLRTRRQALSPAEAGLPAGPRRRTPGLRRSEVAALAGVSVEYLTRLEQGRDRRPSLQVLNALADALRLTAAERARLYQLTKAANPGFSCLGQRPPQRALRPTVRALLNRLEPTPAVLLNEITDLVAYTEGYERLVGPIGLLAATSPATAADGQAGPPNLARYVFTDERARAAFLDWDRVADELVAALKHGPFRAHPATAALADELAAVAGDAFTRRVEAIPGLAPATGILRLAHPAAGVLRLAYEALELSPDDGLRLLVYLPADAATDAALDRVTRPARSLQLVAG